MQEMGISEIQAKMASGELTTRQLAELYLERIATLDRAGPKVNSVIELNPEAEQIADELDAERAAGRRRGPLHGVPVLLKDNIDTGDRMQTTSGSLALEGNYAQRDAGLVEKLRAAGALILGKTNLSEWANFRGRRSTSGWSSRGGLTHNPHALDRTACGSSSGSGAAVAANFCTVAVGTETDGSIICPAQTSGIVGIKPTVGLVSRSGIIPIAHSQDTAGPMARTVADAAVLLGAMAGPDPRDRATKGSAKHGLTDYSSFLDPNGLKGARIGAARSLFGSDTRVLSIMDASLDAMKQAGATIIDVELKSSDAFGKSEVEVLLFEFKAGLNAYLEGCSRARVFNMQDIIRFNEEHGDRVLAYFGQERMEAAQKKGSLRSQKYLNALEKNHRLARTEGIDAVVRKHRLNAIVFPTGGPAWLIDLVNGDGGRNWDMDSTSHAAVAGYPHITVPAGDVFGLPVGVSFIGRAWQEPAIIKLAYAFEQCTNRRLTPQFLPSVNLKQP
jgi:amidase